MFRQNAGSRSVIRDIACLATLAVCIGSVHAKTHVIKVWVGYYKFIPDRGLTVQLGDTVQWLPLGIPLDTHTITSTNIPGGAKPFETVWKAPADTFFQYIPEAAGLYEYHCVPHRDRGMIGSFTVQGAAILRRNVPFSPVLLGRLNPSTRELKFSEPYLGYPFALYDQNGKKLFSGVTGRSVDISNLAAGNYQLEVKAGKIRTQKLIIQ